MGHRMEVFDNYLNMNKPNRQEKQISPNTSNTRVGG